MYIYIVINKLNGMWYVGKRTVPINSSDFEKYFGTGVRIKAAIKEHGIECFEKSVIEACNDKDHLATRELFWLDWYSKLLGKKTSYNIQFKHNYIGREPGFSQSKEHINKRVSARRNNGTFKASDATRKRISDFQKTRTIWNKGLKCPGISKAKTGGKNPMARKVVDTSSGVVFNSIKEAADHIGIHHQTLYSRISRSSTKTTFAFT